MLAGCWLPWLVLAGVMGAVACGANHCRAALLAAGLSIAPPTDEPCTGRPPQIFRSPRDVAEAVQDAVALLGVPRSALGITTSSKGLVAGHLVIHDQRTGLAGRLGAGRCLLYAGCQLLPALPAQLHSCPVSLVDPASPTLAPTRHRHRLQRLQRRRADPGRRNAHLARLGL